MATQAEIDEQCERIRVWAESEEGQREIREAMQRAEEAIRKLNEDRHVPWERLREPMTI